MNFSWKSSFYRILPWTCHFAFDWFVVYTFNRLYCNCNKTVYFIASSCFSSIPNRTVEEHTWRKIPHEGNHRHWLVSYLKIHLMNSSGSAFMIFVPPPLGAGGIMFSGCPSVRPSIHPSVHPSIRRSKAWNNLFSPVHRSVGPSDQQWPFCGMSVRPSVHLSEEVSGHLPENVLRE